jgi:tetratricopeptide (TPR) repeat protein
MERLSQAIRLYQETGDAIRQAVAEMNLGNVYLRLFQVEQAETHYLQAERVLRHGQGRPEQAQIYHNLGLVYIEKQDWLQAQVCLERAVNVWCRLGQARGLVNSLDSLGELWIKRDDAARAREALLEALKVLDRSSQTPAMEKLRQLVNARLGELESSPEIEPAETK